jgi:DNA-binding transcriptional ArsR family regulator
MVRAFAHPLRLEILRSLGERASPTDLSRRLGQPLGTVSYHVRVLADQGLLRLVEQAPRRGAIEHYYAAAPGLVAEMLQPSLDEKGREELEAAMVAFRDHVGRIEREAAARVDGGGRGSPAVVMLLGFAGVKKGAR